MLYSALALQGKFTIDELKTFRQWGSVCPGHPERDIMHGIENTSGPLGQLHNAKVLLRAHGEPPATYAQAQAQGITVIDATCPVVLGLQRRIKKVYDEHPEAQIVIYGKPGHAEVLGLLRQTPAERT